MSGFYIQCVAFNAKPVFFGFPQGIFAFLSVLMTCFRLFMMFILPLTCFLYQWIIGKISGQLWEVKQQSNNLLMNNEST